MSERPFVDFFVAGVQKGGTNALDHLLRLHPYIRMARVKEPHFFDDETVDWSRPDLAAYHSHFDLPSDEMAVVGEATPILSYWPGALERVAAYNHQARIILCLRHPTFRAYSHWRQDSTRQEEDLPFSDAIRERGRSRVRAAPGGVHRVFSYVERGFYAQQVERLFRLFPTENVMFIRTDCLWSQPESVLQKVFSFLGLRPLAKAPERVYDVWIDTRALGPMGPRDRQYLDGLYAEDIRKTEELTSMDLSDWLDPNYAEPMGVTVANKA